MWLCPGNDLRRKSPEDRCQNSCVMSFLHSVRNKVHKWEKWNNWSSLSLERNWQKPGAGDSNTFKCSWKQPVLKKNNTGNGAVFSTARCGRLEGVGELKGKQTAQQNLSKHLRISLSVEDSDFGKVHFLSKKPTFRPYGRMLHESVVQ